LHESQTVKSEKETIPKDNKISGKEGQNYFGPETQGP